MDFGESFLQNKNVWAVVFVLLVVVVLFLLRAALTVPEGTQIKQTANPPKAGALSESEVKKILSAMNQKSTSTPPVSDRELSNLMQKMNTPASGPVE